MRILVACEESQAVTIAMRAVGAEAYSCDIQEPSGGHPEWHILGDALQLINGDCTFRTMDGTAHEIVGPWDMLIAHPPCTFLTNVGNRHFSLRCTPPEVVVKRWEERGKAAVFFMRFALADCPRIAVENPVGFMTTAFRPPDQYIEPWMFAAGADDTENYYAKKTGLWLKGLPKLQGNGIVCGFNCADVYGRRRNGKAKTWEENNHGPKRRSVTPPGIARAIAEQWVLWESGNDSPIR